MEVHLSMVAKGPVVSVSVELAVSAELVALVALAGSAMGQVALE